MNFFYYPNNSIVHIMRYSALTIIFLITTLQLCFSYDIVAQEILKRKVNLSVQNETLRNVIKQINLQTQADFVYSSKSDLRKIYISVKAQDRKLESVLNEILPHNLAYEVVGNKIIIKNTTSGQETGNIISGSTESFNKLLTSASKDVVVKGQVTDTKGEALIGVSVKVKGTNNGVSTDINGQYSLTMPDGNGILVFTYVGYVMQEVVVNNRQMVNVALIADEKSLDEVVVVGYGVQRKSDLTGAVGSVKGDELQKTPANTFVQALQGRVSGVDIKAASNAPGGDMRIRIRGTNSINASSEPLYVIDGFPIDNNNNTPQGAGNNALSPSPLSSLSPNDIESIEILKDASATAIYGSRGANGVILITTKNGKAGKAKISFDYSVNASSVRKKLDLANAEELAVLTNEWAINNGLPLIYDGVKKPLPAELGKGTDWQNAIFRTALTNNYNLSVSGGTEKTKYLVSGNYLDQDGIIIESNFKRAGLRFNLDQKVSERIKIGVNMNANRTVNDAIPSDGTGYQTDSPLWNALTTTPVIPIMDANGDYVHNYSEANKILENPVSIAKTRTDLTYTNRILSSAFTEIGVLNGLTFRANFGADVINSKRNVYIPNTAQIQALPNKGIASIGSVQSLTWLTEYTLTYNKEFSGSHRLTALAGYTAQASQRESLFSETD
ncbi:MAG: SusC/RagA family TonB-linked outer membrane protein, partial [Daejeonella sp.]